MDIQKSEIVSNKPTFGIEPLNKDESIKIFKDIQYAEIFSIYVPSIKAKL